MDLNKLEAHHRWCERRALGNSMLEHFKMSQDKFFDTYENEEEVPGICSICEEISEVKADCEEGYCENCGKFAVISSLTLMDAK